jgi:hypothetical protein
MHSVIYILIWIGCSLALSLFSFLLGRCARRLPLIDDCMLPWVMHRDSIPLAPKWTERADMKPPDHLRISQ